MAIDSTDKFVDALRSAKDGDTIEVEDRAYLNLSQYKPGDFDGLAHNLKVVAGSGMANRPAATINYTPGERVDGALLKTWGNIDFAGFRVIGPESRPIPLDRDYELCFLHAMGDKFTVGGCYFEGWPFAAIASGAKNRETELTFRNSTVRNCWMGGYGYAVEQYNGYATYSNLDIDKCRHGIAGFGWPTCSYEVKDCRFGPLFTSHQVDMHRASESAGQNSLDEKNTSDEDAGGDMYIHDNTFEMTHDYNEEPQEAIAIRGIPTGQAIIENNQFKHAEEPKAPGGQGTAIRQQGVDDWTNVTIRENEFGVKFTIPQHVKTSEKVVPVDYEPEEPAMELTAQELLDFLAGQEIELTGNLKFQ